MFLVVYISLAAAIASTVANPIIGVILSLLAYFLLNFIPHWSYQSSHGTAKIIFTVFDYVSAAIAIFLFAKYLPEFINSNHFSTSVDTRAFYPFELTILSVILCTVSSILPELVLRIRFIFKNFPKTLECLNFYRENMINYDAKIMGRVIQPAAVLVFSLYSFRLLPNSESGLFLTIICLMFAIVAILAVMEVFADVKN